MNKFLLKMLVCLLLACVGLCCVSCADDSTDEKKYVSVGTSTQSKTNYKIEPTITLQTGDYSIENAPNAVKGLKYKVFDACAVDVYNDALEVSVGVYYNYYTQTRSEVSFVDNAFVPDMFGVYTIVYTATDVFNNQAVVTYNVKCQEKEAFSASLTDKLTVGTVGDKIDVAKISFDNFIGEVDFSVQAVSKNGYAVYAIGDDMSFYPEYCGDYEIKYICNDYNETTTISYDIKVSDNPLPIFKTDVVLNKYYIVDCFYEMPMPDCYYSIEGKRYEVIPSVSIQYSDGSNDVIVNGKFKPTKEGTVVVTYTARFGSARSIKEYTVKAVDVGYSLDIQMDKYFYSDAISTKPLDYGVRIVSRSETSFDFINPICASGVSAKLAIDENNNNFEKLDIILTDENNENLSVKFSLVKGENGCVFYVNDRDYIYVSTSFYGEQLIEFNFDNDKQEASLDGSTLDVDKYYNGEKFNGFTGDNVYLSFAFDGVVENAGLLVYQIDNSVLSNAKRDNFEPFVTFTRFMGDKAVGDVIDIERIYVADVLDPNYTVNYTVVGPDGQYVSTLGGVVLDGNASYNKQHSFKALMLGRYVVSIKVNDSFDNQTNYSYAIEVKDNKSPTIILGEGETSASLEKNITLKTATATDNYTEKMEIDVYIRRPDYAYEVATNGGSYTPTQKGTYTVFYYTVDEYGNIAIAEYQFTVK